MAWQDTSPAPQVFFTLMISTSPSPLLFHIQSLNRTTPHAGTTGCVGSTDLGVGVGVGGTGVGVGVGDGDGLGCDVGRAVVAVGCTVGTDGVAEFEGVVVAIGVGELGSVGVAVAGSRDGVLECCVRATARWASARKTAPWTVSVFVLLTRAVGVLVQAYCIDAKT